MRLVAYLLVTGCFILSSLNLYAATFVGGFEGNIWSDPRNWSPQQVPNDEAIVPENKHVVVDGPISVGTLILGGTLAGDGNPNSKLTITTGFSWTNGLVNVPVYLGNGCAALWQGSLGLNANLFNFGEVTVSANVFISYSTLKNEAEGVLNLTDGFKLQIINNPAILDNYGTIRRTGLGGIFQILLGNHINRPGAETIVEAGELYASGLDNYAPINIATGATFHSHDFRIFNGTTFTGGGLLKSTGNGMYMNNTELITIDVANTELNSQGIKETGQINFPHHLDWKTGTLFAQVTFTPGSIVDINPGGLKGITNTTVNHGTINVNDSFGFDIGRLDNHGIMNLNGAFTNGIYHASEGIHNYGVIQKPGGAIGTYNMGVQLFNEPGGQLLVQQDELHCSGNLFNSGEIIVYAGATLRSNFTETRNGSTYSGPGTFIIQSNGLNAANTTPVTLDFSEMVINASLNGAGTVILTGQVDWIAGTFAAPVILANSSIVDMNPGGAHGVTGTTTNDGTLNINTSFTLSAGQIINNGLFSLNGPHAIGIFFGTPGIFNHGTILKTATSGGTFNMGVPLTNHSSGSVAVENGELYVASSFTNAGSLNVSAGATFRANQTVVQNGASFTGAGTYLISSTGLTANNTANVNFDIAETEFLASLNGTGMITFSQHVSWKNANLNCPVTIAAGGILDLLAPGAHGIGNSITLTNHGTINANVSFGGGTVFNNGTLYLTGGTSASSTINNAGTLVKNTGGNVTISYLNNMGTVQALGENLFLNGLTNAGAINVAAGANVLLDGYNNNTFEAGGSINGAGVFTLAAPLTANGNASIGVQTFVLAATYYGISGVGVLTFSHSFEWQSGSIGNIVVIETGGVMNISGVDFKNLSGTLTNNGTVNCDADLDISPGAIINNNSIFHLTNGSLFGPSYYVAGDFNNAGNLNKSSSGTLLFNTFLNNLAGGSVLVNSGTLETGKLDNAGSITIGADATLTVNDGSNLTGGVVSGSGTLRIAANGWNLASNLIVSSLTLEIAGNLSSSTGATLELESTATWFSGDISVPVNIATSGVFSTESYGSKYISANLVNSGVFNSNAGWYTDGSVTNNGQFFVAGEGTFSNYSGQVFSNTNSGLLKIQNNPFGVYVNIQMVNDGSIVIEEGQAYLQNGLTNNGALTIETGAALLLGGNDFFNSGSTLSGSGRLEISNSLTLNTPLSFSGEKFVLYGNLSGVADLNILSAMEWNYGNIQTDVTITSGATLEIGGGSGGGGGGSLTAPFPAMVSEQSKPGPISDFSAKSKSSSLEKSFYGQVLYASITNNGTTTQEGGYDMDNGTFTNNNLLITHYGGIHDGGNGGILNNNGTWQVDGYFECYISAVNNGILNGIGELDFQPEFENNGTVAPGFSPGQLSFTNNYQNGVQLNMQVESSAGPGVGHDYLEAGDNLLLGGALTVTETGSPLDGTYTILHCNGGPGCRTGVFANTSIPMGYQLSYTGESVILIKGMPIQLSPADTTICAGNPVTITAPAAESYAWSTGENTQSIEVYPYETSTYYVTVNYSGGGGALGNATVQVAYQPYVNIDPYYAYICQGELVTLTAYSSDENYLWSTGETTQSIAVSPNESTSYSVTVTNAAGCTASTSVYVEVAGEAAVPEITDVPATLCQSESPIYLHYYQGGYYGEWSGPGVFNSYFDPTGLSGQQTLTFTPYPSQCSTTATWSIDVIISATWYADADGDGYGNAAIAQTACSQPEGYVSNDDDCNDSNPGINPGASETCNGTDDDCDGQTDEGVGCGTDADGDGYTNEQGDCNDENPNIHPNAPEICNGVDDDCDELIDETTLIIDPVVVTHVACGGGNTGAVDITVSGGTPGYTYQWSNNRTTQDISNVGANTYSVTVTDANGCTMVASATVNPKLALTLSKTNTTCNGGSDGTVTANITGGTPGYTYLWNTGATTQTIENLGIGTYSVTVTDALGCSRTKSINVGQPAAISVSGTVQHVTCNGTANGSITISHNNGTAPFTYAWSDGVFSMNRTDLAPGSYTITVTDANGCTRSRAFNVTEPNALELSFSVYHVTCNGSADARIITTTTGGKKYPTSALCNNERYCYNWSNGATSRNLSDLAPGVYGLTVTDANGCTITGSVTIDEPDALEITEVGIMVLPNGKYQLVVTASGGTLPYRYRRIPGGGYQVSNVLNNVPAGSYQIVVRDDNSCTDTLEISVPANAEGLSIEEPEAGNLIAANSEDEVPSIYPNPAQDLFYVKLPEMPENGFIRIFEMNGRVIAEQKLIQGTDLYPFYTDDWQAGIYLVYIQKGQVNQTLRLVITVR
ncbi:MAG: T9SS type A sorting domain-containing protein [Saprospiraceae bacterium]|nr:T9SS type A sorting domain-containing protein [Saprospiraceae bacterium]